MHMGFASHVREQSEAYKTYLHCEGFCSSQRIITIFSVPCA